MRIAMCKLKSKTPYSQSRYHRTEKLSKELACDFEKRTWREKCNSDKSGEIFIPPMAFANSLKEAAKYLSIPIPGMGKSKFTKHFESGVLVADPLYLGINKKNVDHEWVYVPSDGRRGGTKRVDKCFPLIHSWEGTVTYYVFDDIITKDVFEKVLNASGQLIGIGRFRPRNWGYYGRFVVEEIKWEEQ